MKKAIIVSGLLLLSMFSGMLMLPTTNVEATTEEFTSDAYKDGWLMLYNDWWPPEIPQSVEISDIIRIGRQVFTGTYYEYKGYLSFDTSIIPDDATIMSATLTVHQVLRSSYADFDVMVYNADYGVSLDLTDGVFNGTYQNVLMDVDYRYGIPSFDSAEVNTNCVNMTGPTDFILKVEILEGAGAGYVDIGNARSAVEYRPSLSVVYGVQGTIVQIDMVGGTQYELDVFPVVSDWNLTYDRWTFYLDSTLNTDNFTLTIDETWEYMSSSPYSNVTVGATSIFLGDVGDYVTYTVWLTVPKANPLATVHIAYYNAFTGEGFAWETLRLKICDGLTWDNTTDTDLTAPDFSVTIGTNHTVRVTDFFGNVLVDYPFTANANTLYLSIPVPVYSWQVFNMNEAPVLMKIYWNNTGSPWEFFVGPQWIIERNLKGGNYTFAVTFYNTDNTVGDTVYYEREIPLSGLNASFIYVNGTTLSEIITDIEGVMAAQTIITSLISPSIVLIYEDLPIVPVRIRGMVLSEMISLDPYMILEATTYQNKTGTQFVNSALWLPYPDILGATYYNISDTLQFVGTYDTTIYINDTSGTNLYYSTVLPATVNLQSQNITIWANNNYSVSRTSTWREVSEYEITSYQTEHKWQTTLSLNNTMSFDYHSPYWYIAFPEDATIDTTTVTVYDLDNDVLLDGRLNYAVTAGGIHVTLTQMNASNARNFQLTFWDANSTTGIGAPNLVAEAYTQSTLDGTPMKYTAVQWTNPWSVEYLGEVYITMNFTEGADLFVDSITIIDETSGTVIPSSQWIYTGRTILILTDGVGTVPVGGARNYGVYFTLSTTIDRDDGKPDLFFGPIVINGKQWYINDWPISAFAILLCLGWCVVGWRWWGNKRGASNLLLIAVSATVVGMYFYYMMN